MPLNAVCHPYLRPSRAMFSRWPGLTRRKNTFMEVGFHWQLISKALSAAKLVSIRLWTIWTFNFQVSRGDNELTQIGTNHNTSPLFVVSWSVTNFSWGGHMTLQYYRPIFTDIVYIHNMSSWFSDILYVYIQCVPVCVSYQLLKQLFQLYGPGLVPAHDMHADSGSNFQARWSVVAMTLETCWFQWSIQECSFKLGVQLPCLKTWFKTKIGFWSSYLYNFDHSERCWWGAI